MGKRDEEKAQRFLQAVHADHPSVGTPGTATFAPYTKPVWQSGLRKCSVEECPLPVIDHVSFLCQKHTDAQKVPGMPKAERAEAWALNDKPDTSLVCLQADAIINGDRKRDYGNPAGSFERIARMWSEVLGTEVTAYQVALMLIQLKVARAMNDLKEGRGIKRDTAVDIAGYAGCLDFLGLR